MKQTSLLDSFIRRQQPTLNSREKDPPILLAPSESVQREHQEEQNAEKRISELMISSERTPVIGRQSFGVAHQEEQEIGQRSHKRKRMDIDDYSVIEEDYCHGPKLDDFNAGFERPNKPEHKNQNEEQEDIKNENRKSMGVKKGYSKVDNRRKDEDN